MKFALLLASTFALSAFADRPVYLDPGESQWINGTKVTCTEDHGGGGGGHGSVRRNFQCAIVNGSFPSLDNNLTVRSENSLGNISVDNLFKFGRQANCQIVAQQLNGKCATGRICSHLFCEADNSSFPSLETTLYQVKTQGPNQLTVVSVQKFQRQSECQQAAR